MTAARTAGAFWAKVRAALAETTAQGRRPAGPGGVWSDRAEASGAGVGMGRGVRRHSTAALAADWQACADRGLSMSVLLIEIDGFAALAMKDRDAASGLLAKITDTVRHAVPPRCRLVREDATGQIIVTVPDGPILMARMYAQNLRREAEGLARLSIGIAAANPAACAEGALLDAAALALSRAVERGRDQVVTVDLRAAERAAA